MAHRAMAGNQLDLKFLIVLFKVFMVRCLYSKCDLFIIIYDYAGTPYGSGRNLPLMDSLTSLF